MRENPLKKNSRFYLGMVLNVAEGMLSGFNFLLLYEAMKMLWNGTINSPSLLRLSLFLGGVFILRIVIYSIGYTQSQIGGAAVSNRTRLFLGDKIKRIPLSRFTQGQTGQYINIVTSDVNNYEKILTHTVGDILKHITFCTMMVIFVGCIWLPGGIILACVELVLIPFLWLSFRVVRKYGTEKNAVSAETVSSIVEYATGIQTFRAMYLTEIRPLQEISSNMAQVLKAVTKTEEILELPIYEGGGDFPQAHDIELRNVRFSYDGKVNVLEHCNLKVKNGERMALVGRSGAGKSTVIELISRFYDVQEGEVLIGGKNVKEINYETLLQNIAIVFQKTFLTRDSVFENIRMGSNATLEEVRAAAKEAQIDDFIMSLPDGYDTKVGSFGSRFSGGEKQRIAIARAILKNAPILILDEATSAADPENQVEIDKAIENLCKGKTVIVVAHRLGALKMCNRVAVVENHSITSVGTHDEVRQDNAYYNQAWTDYETARNITYQLEGGADHA